MPEKTLLILSQVFVPDPASVGQHMADVAVEMACRGHRVKVYASARGYEDPTRRYALRENFHGVDVHRLDLASFGKKSILTRIAGTVSFMTQVLFRVLTEKNLGGIFFSTSPPLIGFVAALAGRLRSVPVAYWAMDLNPDQLIALGKLKPTDFAARILERVNRFILRRSDLVVALDRFMARRLEQRMPLL
jgi:colanic acid biosynthesis glycosyl transferase WcaI